MTHIRRILGGTMENIVSATDLQIGYDQRSVLAKIKQFDVKQGDLVSIIGESGIGKTTFLKTIANLISPISGKLKVFGETGITVRGRIGYIPQRLGLINHESVYSNVLQGAVCNEPIWRSITGLHERKIIDNVLEIIDRMKLSEKSDTPVKKLSGGQQRRVAIARTMAQNPKLILADEFLSELDDVTAEHVWKIMLNYIKDTEITLIIVEHNRKRARMAQRCFEMSEGKDGKLPNLMEVTDD